MDRREGEGVGVGGRCRWPVAALPLATKTGFSARYKNLADVVNGWERHGRDGRPNHEPVHLPCEAIHSVLVEPVIAQRFEKLKSRCFAGPNQQLQMVSGSTSTAQRTRPLASGALRQACSTGCQAAKNRCKAPREALSTSICARSTLATRWMVSGTAG